MFARCESGFVFLALLAVGCGQTWKADYSKLGLVEVSGRITLDGAPVANASVIFENPDATYSYGTTDAEGKYSLMFNSEKSGTAPGPKIVRVRAAGSLSEGEDAPSEGASSAASQAKESIPAAYNTNSQLQVTIDGSSQVVNFDLKSDGSVKGPTG